MNHPSIVTLFAIDSAKSEGDRFPRLAPDGETLVVTRGELSRDAVLIENFLPTQ